MAVKITDVKCFVTSPDRANLVVVKLETNQPGLYGLGCATFTQRALAVRTAIEEYLAPVMIGRDVSRLEDAWQVMYGQSYWRSGPVLNNAISGVDEALWDIKGKMANMPVYDILGGKVREGALVYRMCRGADYDEFDRKFSDMVDEGYQVLKVGIGAEGRNAPLSDAVKKKMPFPDMPGSYFDPQASMDAHVRAVSHAREVFGYDQGLIVDIHERLSPSEAVEVCKRLDGYRMFFIEDAIMPENQEWFRRVRAHTTTPLAMGELYTSLNDIRPMIEERLIDYLRCHVSDIGGLTSARKLATLCELYGVRTCWHGPGDLSPIGLTAQLHLDLASPAFGLQEFTPITDIRYEMFPGAPTFKNGYLFANDRPGFGIDFNEELAKKYPPKDPEPDSWQARRPDGTVVRN